MIVRYRRGKKLDAQTPVDRLGICWCVDESGRGAYYPTGELRLALPQRKDAP